MQESKISKNPDGEYLKLTVRIILKWSEIIPLCGFIVV